MEVDKIMQKISDRLIDLVLAILICVLLVVLLVSFLHEDEPQRNIDTARSIDVLDTTIITSDNVPRQFITLIQVGDYKYITITNVSGIYTSTNIMEVK
jgi:hypothetical protein